MKNFKRIISAACCAIVLVTSVPSAYAQTNVEKIKPDGMVSAVVAAPKECRKENSAVIVEFSSDGSVSGVIRQEDKKPCDKEKPAAAGHVEESKKMNVERCGTSRSDTDTSLNVVAKWKIYEQDGKHFLKVDAVLEHGALRTVKNEEGLVITIGDKTYVLEAPKISYYGKSLTTTELGSKTIELGDDMNGKTLPINVEWSFYGTYSNTDIDIIRCSDRIAF